ncbi:MAG: glycosyltransferase [Acidobacteria bacterium]|nr:glycosyltransferase [Acidobacteriota bacterium]MBI3657911.1 glycosyltransferase [Acidobacteriota bacterium]
MNNRGTAANENFFLVGYPGVEHVGAHLQHAAQAMGLRTLFFNAAEAFVARAWQAKLNWWLRGHLPVRLQEFSEQIVDACRKFQPRRLVSTGLAPIESWALESIGKLGIQRVNYLTDDPWNRAHRAPWFMKALPFYDHVFSTRRVNLNDLQRAGCPKVSYLPFAYNPSLHFPDPPATPAEQAQFAADVAFVGGGDADRVPWIAALSKAGFKVALYGGYWERYAQTRTLTRGYADPWAMRKAVGAAKLSLGLVRRANRDGNSMRTFEIPAIGAAMLVEDTEEHRDIFGEEGQAVVYFQTKEELIRKIKWLLPNDGERARLAQSSYRMMVSGRNTYRDRLQVLLGLPAVDSAGREPGENATPPEYRYDPAQQSFASVENLDS